jgi:hypothetical protein
MTGHSCSAALPIDKESIMPVRILMASLLSEEVMDVAREILPPRHTN